MSCPCLQSSPPGGSTLMTSAPKSDKMTAALGPAMKLARSTTFKPEKMLSVAFVSAVTAGSSSPLELWRAFLQEGPRAFLLVFGAGAQPEEGSFECHAFGLARLHALVHRLERELDRERRVGEDLFQDRFGACEKLCGG